MVSVKLKVPIYTFSGRGLIVPYNVGRRLWSYTRRYYCDALGNKYNTRYKEARPDEVRHNKGEKILYNIWLKNQTYENKIHRRLWSILKHDDIWIESYIKLSNKSGSWTKGSDNLNITDLSLNSVMKIKESVLNNTFKWDSIKRVMIPKTSGGKRPLGIPTIKDRLVQDVLRRILSSIYEPTFNIHSHGFRPEKSCHSALGDIRKNFKGCKWLIEGDISKFFDSVSHKKLIEILKERIDDDRLLSLIYKGCKATILLPNSGSIKNKRGTPQGGILSPLLSNIYLDKFDKFMMKLEEKHNRGRQRKESLIYRQTARKLGFNPTDMMDPNYRRLKYVRYADDFIIGLACNKEIALQIKNEIKDYLFTELQLFLDDRKTKLTDCRKNMGHFLGYTIGMHKGIVTWTPTGKRRLTGKGHVILKVDKDRLIKSLNQKGFCKKDGTPIPKFTYLSDTQAVTNEKINRIIIGILNYYNLADNKVQTGCHLFYLFTHSLAKLYAAKFRWHRKATIFKMGGRDLSKQIKISKGYIGKVKDDVEVKVKGIIYSNYYKIEKPDRRPRNPDVIQTWETVYKGRAAEVKTVNEVLRRHSWNGPIIDQETECKKCGSNDLVELHHKRALKKVKDNVKMLMLARATRKVIPLCRRCHKEIHGGSFK